VLCLSRRFASDEHVAHQCGTLRFGRDPAHAVLDPDCRLFRHPNVFVVDGSFFPTSLGVGPALTIMANALRVAKLVSREL
jgi:choline dehydrogenase-like flavoprotein